MRRGWQRAALVAALIPLLLLSQYVGDRLYEQFEIRWLASLVWYGPLMIVWQVHIRQVFLPASEVVAKWIGPLVVLPWIAADGLAETFGEHWWTNLARFVPLAVAAQLYWHNALRPRRA